MIFVTKSPLTTSDALTTDDIIYEANHDEVRVSANIGSNIDYYIKSTSIHDNLTSTTSTGTYSNLYGNLVFCNSNWKRVVTIVHTPTAVMVFLAYLSFFIDPKRQATARLLYCLVVVLISVLIIHGYNVNNQVRVLRLRYQIELTVEL